jgi:hypothetical protein
VAMPVLRADSIALSGVIFVKRNVHVKKISPKNAKVERIVPYGKDYIDLLQQKQAQELETKSER